MKYVICGVCSNENVPFSASLTVDGSIFCDDCFKSSFTSDEQLKGKSIFKEMDPTICFSCGTDFGHKVLTMIASHPVCEPCHEIIKNRSFPVWVKVFLAFVVATIIFSFVWNWRFLQGYESLHQFYSASARQDFDVAAAELENVSMNVPEMPQFIPLVNFYKGVAFLKNNKPEQALIEFMACRDSLSNDYPVDALILQAEMGVSFDKKDYNKFLQSSKAYLDRDTTVAISWASVSSAYACLYVSTKADSMKQLSDQYLAKALSFKDTTKEFSDFVNRIHHRVETGEIVTREEFNKKFPSGWTKN